MHFSINAHAVQGFSLKQVRACLRLEPLSLKLNGSRCGLAYGLPCGLLYVLLYGFLYGLLCGLLCGLLYSLLRELLYGLLCSVRHAFPLLLPSPPFLTRTLTKNRRTRTEAGGRLFVR